MVKMSGTPIILVAAVGCRISLLGVIVQQPCLGGVGRANNMLQVTFGISGDILLRKAITRTGDKDANIDDEATQGCNGGLEARENRLWRPDVGREVLGERVL